MRSLQIHPALWCVMTLLQRITDPAFCAPPADEHPRRGFAAVDSPGRPGDDGAYPVSVAESGWTITLSDYVSRDGISGGSKVR